MSQQRLRDYVDSDASVRIDDAYVDHPGLSEEELDELFRAASQRASRVDQVEKIATASSP